MSTSFSIHDIAYWAAWITLLLTGGATMLGIRYIYKTADVGAVPGSFPKWKRLIYGFEPVILGFLLLAFICFAMYISFWLFNFSIGVADNSLFRGFLASLIEDIFFFVFIGFLVIIVQKREFEKNANIETRIDALFNAEKLTSSEIEYLRHQVSRIGCDFKWNETFIDVVSILDEFKSIKLDVSRRFHVANYLNDIDCMYEWKIDIRPDKISGLTTKEPMRLFPFYMKRIGYVELDETGRKTLRRINSDSEILHEGIKLDDADRFDTVLRGTRISPHEVCEFRMRYEGWQPVSVNHAPYPYEIESTRHWDNLEVTVRNSLERELRIKITGPAGDRTVSVGPGDQIREAFVASDIPRDAQILVSFILD